MGRRRRLGIILWAIGRYGFGGLDNSTGAVIAAAGCLVVIAALSTEYVLRRRGARSAGWTGRALRALAE